MKKAFTLAEVLITLTIIGVIAAITIPNLMQSYKKHQVEVKVKSAYSILSNAITMSKTENGSFAEMLTNCNADSAYCAKNYIKPYLKYGRYCGTHNGTEGNINCPFNNKTYKSVAGNGRIAGLDGEYWSGMVGTNLGTKFALDNGMFLYIKENTWEIAFVVDINGDKGPNMAAYDIFAFALIPSRQNYLIGGYFGGDNKCEEGSNKNAHGLDCAYYIQKNGWKIPDNYPVKKF